MLLEQSIWSSTSNSHGVWTRTEGRLCRSLTCLNNTKKVIPYTRMCVCCVCVGVVYGCVLNFILVITDDYT